MDSTEYLKKAAPLLPRDKKAHNILSIISGLGWGNVPSRSPALEKYSPVHGLSAQAGPLGTPSLLFMAPSQDNSNGAQQKGLDPLTCFFPPFVSPLHRQRQKFSSKTFVCIGSSVL